MNKMLQQSITVLLLIVGLCFTSSNLLALEQNTVERALAQARASGKKPNHLINESSPYLLQHAYNPVQWYAWGDVAFAKARKENKPVFLSIGYSTCHWCHVMAHESFENPEIAKLINQYFIAIKVDREERPDIDSVYMAATQLINGQGGWPMTVFLNHKLQPFHAGTYFPPETRGHYRGLNELLPDIHQLWVTQRARVDDTALQITQRIQADAIATVAPAKLDNNIVARALQQMAAVFDEDDGGFGSAPKFPQPGVFMFLLRLAEQDGAEAANAKRMLQKTLTRMAQGGIFDQVGGGFHRYSVDAQWRVPHFEKMLYSQALMTIAYLRLYEIDQQPLYKNTARATLDFVSREMTSPQGGFYSALDADSERPDKKGEHAEGAFYLWSDAELAKLLTAEELKFVREYYQVRADGNIDSDPQNEFTGLNIFQVSDEYSDKALSQQQAIMLAALNIKLQSARDQRLRPHLDDKIITAWNGMMMSAFAQADVILKDKHFLNTALQAAGFMRDHLLDKKTGKLYRRSRAGQAGVEAGLSDYVWVVRGLLDVYAAGKDRQWLELAIALAQRQDALFLDPAGGGYFDAVDNDASLLFRSRSIYDGALPAENAIALVNLSDLYKITKDKRWEKNAANLLAGFAGFINENPFAAAMVLSVTRK